ncbi:hypothetical protein MUB18_14445 [Sphingobacterium sp. PCS056]|uniref:hypothetical protein n=1 Tax=Sphingobacterium sp. PCS056 TaxID=2931400 RepID=UPI00200CAA54|nr:hypothetical protein [Sphingobacterium sp. PCS056]UPZ35306.1 hypothetical protein MUB18_14445 [Sphingobacterium sp. PCS056]
MQIIFIHGRDQQRFSQETLLGLWTENLKQSFEQARIPYTERLEIKMPHYGKELIELRDKYKKDIRSGKYQMKSAGDEESLDDIGIIQLALIDDLRKHAGISDEEFALLMRGNEQQRGWKNKETVLKIARRLDERQRKISNMIVRLGTSDVVTYLVVPEAKKVINKYFTEVLSKEPTIVIAHSLGTIIAYDMLHTLKRENYDIRGVITLGSPLGVNSVIRQLYPPPSFPMVIRGNWTNIYDESDFVSLRPLNGGHFKVDPMIINHIVVNTTKNRHGIEGYLSNPIVAQAISEILNSDKFKTPIND